MASQNYEENTAEEAFQTTASLRAAIQRPSLPPLNLQAVAVLGLNVANELDRPEIKKRFGKLHPDLLPPELISRIRPAAWALWYATVQRRRAQTQEKGGRVSVEVLESATEIKNRMMRVAEYMLVDDEEAAAEISSIRANTGHLDLAEDLQRLAQLYMHYAETLSSAGAFYRPEDVDAAKRRAEDIITELSINETTDAQQAQEEAARAFTVLMETYEPVRRFAVALMPDDLTRFPSIFSVRRARRRSPTSEQPDTPEPSDSQQPPSESTPPTP